MSWQLLRDARESAGMTQADVARALRITQSAVAQMERPGSNPTIKTLSTALAVTGHQLHLGMTPHAERVEALRTAYRKTQGR